MPALQPVLESCTWPWPIWTLHAAYLLSGALIAVHYVPQLRRAWQFPEATLAAQSLSTWSVWTLCRAVAFTYGLVVLHDLLFLLVVGADMLGRLAMVALILRAHAISSGSAWRMGGVPQRSEPDPRGMMGVLVARGSRTTAAQRVAAV